MFDESERLRVMIKARDDAAKRLILEHIDTYGKAYSKELKEPSGGISLNHVSRLLRELERAGVLESWLVNPPHEDCKTSGLQRRYYWRPRNISGNKI